jgi:hypothetical protein
MIGQFFARIAGVLGIVAGAQAPEFTAHYMQNLNGRVAELGALVRQYDGIVEDLGTTRDGYVDDLRAANRESTTKTADVIVSTFERYEALSVQLAALRASGDFRRPLILAKGLVEGNDRDIAKSVIDEFKPAVPLTPEAFAYAGGIGVTIWGVLAAIFGVIGSMFGGRRYA